MTQSPTAALGSGVIDLFAEATGTLDCAARAVVRFLEAGMDVVFMNAELDATIGALFHDTARKPDAFYTISECDQPGALLPPVSPRAPCGPDWDRKVLLVRQPLGRIEGPPVAHVAAIAKRDLQRGEGSSTGLAARGDMLRPNRYR